MVTRALDVAFGVVWENFYDQMVDKLKEGDLTDMKCRQWIVRELNDIKSTLDDEARKDLFSCVSFLKDGVHLLILSLDQSSNDQVVLTREQVGVTHHAHSLMKTEVGGSKRGGSALFNEAFHLSQAIRRLNIASESRFASAMSLFEKANTKATEAFSNKALETKDRILAAKLRMTSRILESLHDPDAAADTCKLYLKELHEMPAVREMFSVHFSGGVKSYLMKEARLELIVSVIKISFILCEFTSRFTKTELDIQGWPKIQLRSGEFDPVCDTTVDEVVRKGFTREHPTFLEKRFLDGMRWKLGSSKYV